MKHAIDRIRSRQSDDFFAKKYSCFFGGGGGDSGEEAAEAQVEATEKQIEFAKEVYNRQLQLSAPQRNVGNQALGDLGSMYGYNAGYDPYPVQPFGSGSSSGQRMPTQAECSRKKKGDKACSAAAKAGWPTGQPGQMGGQPMGGPGPGTGGFQGLLNKDPVYAGVYGDTQRFLEQDPGYQFRLEEGQKALDRQGAAAGRLYSGGQLKAAQRYGQNFASGEFGNAFNRANSLRTDAYNRLASLAGLQQTGTASASNALGQLGQQVGQGLGAQGDARASGFINSQNQRQSGFNNLLNASVAGANIFGAIR